VRSAYSEQSTQTERDGAVSQSRTASADTFIRTETALFAVRYAEPRYDRGTRTWEAIAFIDRAEAWAIYEPRLRSLAGPFMAAYEAAEAARDPLRQTYRYHAAARLATADILAALDFAQALNPQQANAFAPVRTALAGAAQKAAAARARVAIAVQCRDDADGIISNAVTGAFSGGGFAVTQAAAGATNTAEARIDSGLQTLEAGTFYTPRLTVTVSGAEGTLFTWTASAARQGARDPAIAKRRAWTALAEEVKRGLWAAFEEGMGVGRDGIMK
jgi:hypothetical protein